MRLCLESKQAEFLVVYGRRRVGKTYLIKEYFNQRFSFYATGVASTDMKEQLGYFHDSLKEYGSTEKKQPANWREAFAQLKEILSLDSVARDPVTGKRIVFIDEVPWMDTARSGFKTALDHFWNSWASSQSDILLIVCGSATSWIIENILEDEGGFYDRVTRQIHLQPFSLAECEMYYASKDIPFGRQEMIESYMVFGGIPFYLNLLDRRLSLAQNIEALVFKENGQLHYEYDRLFRSLFKNPTKHFAIISAIAQKRYGMTREEIQKATKIGDGALLTKALSELQQCGFIRKYRNFTTKKNGCIYQVIDPFVLFCFEFMQDKKLSSWMSFVGKPGYYTWCGLAFEIVCLNHIKQLKAALGISGVETSDYSWRSDDAQIDLLIDRMDKVINICEMKYSLKEYEITAEYEKNLAHKLEAFRDATGTKKALHITMVTANGLSHNSHSGIVVNEIDGDALFA
ncbi:MAG: ATP-binding protein [Firmicutes bacterium]|nr:ATP-binding protein [Bacillota bacterium]